MRVLVLCEGEAVAATELSDHSRILQSVWLHGRSCPVLGDGLELSKVGQADNGRAPLLGCLAVGPELHVYLACLFHQEVLHGSGSVPGLSSSDRPRSRPR